MHKSQPLSPTARPSMVSLEDYQRLAALSRATYDLLVYWRSEGVVEPDVNQLIAKIEPLWEAMPCQCTGGPHTADNPWCTRHCEERQETRA
jgi:hypothetical protein